MKRNQTPMWRLLLPVFIGWAVAMVVIVGGYLSTRLHVIYL